MLAALARRVTAAPRTALGLWLVAIAVLGVIGAGTNGKVPFANVHLAHTESARELALREQSFGRSATVSVLVEGTDSAVTQTGTSLVARLRRDPANHVLSPFDHLTHGGATLRAHDAALVVVVRSLRRGEQPADALAPVRSATRAARGGAQLTVTGPVAVAAKLNKISLDSAAKAQMIALPLLLLVLLLLFRSPVAALVPLTVGGATVAASTGLVRIGLDLGAQFDVFAPTIAGILGLALGVDYSLLIVTRFRALIAGGETTPATAGAAAVQTTLTAGRTVAHAAAVVAVAMACALVLAPGTSLTSMAYAVLTTTAVACVSAIVAVPAALALLAPYLDRWRLGSAPRLGAGRAAQAVLTRPRQASAALAVPLVGLALLGAAVHPAAPTILQLKPHEPARAAIERLRADFGVGWEAPLEITAVADHGPATAPRTFARLVALQHRIARLPGVHLVIGPADVAAAQHVRSGASVAARRNAASVLVDLDRGSRAMRLFVVPTSRWGWAGLARLRSEVVARLAGVQRRGDIQLAVGGVAAETVEYNDIVSRRLLVLFIALALTSVALMMFLLRTLVVALVTVGLNVITVGATLGILKLLFVGAHPPGGGPGQIDSMALTMILLVVFALSIDYQVFLLGRMREFLPVGTRRSRCDTTRAIGQALVTTGPVVTGAALIMCTVFGAFASTQSVFLRQLGGGLTVAIALDATIVRRLLLPAALTVAGRDAWRVPSWLPGKIRGSHVVRVAAPGEDPAP